MTSPPKAPKPTQPVATAPKTGAERQQAYRQRKKLHFLEVTEETYSRLRNIRKQRRWTSEQAVAEALTLLEAEIKAAARSVTLAEMHRRPAAEEANRGVSQSTKRPAKGRKPKPPVETEQIEGQGNLL